MSRVIDGKAVAAKVRAEAKELVSQAQAAGIKPSLAVILVGDDPASASYVRMKSKDCAECGIATCDHHLPAQTTQEELEGLIERCNGDESIHGILVQMPLPAHLDPEAVIACISPSKDVDGFTSESLGRLVRGIDGFSSCTPAGIMRLLEEYGIDVAGKRAVVIGRSTIVGKPMALMLLQKDATVTHCHSKTPDLAPICRGADIIVSAAGRASTVRGDMIKEGAVIIDVGTNIDEEGNLCGDVDFADVEPICDAITPVPGGVGPMTRAMLMLNTAKAAVSSL